MEIFGDTIPVNTETRKLLNKTYSDMLSKRRPGNEEKAGRKNAPKLKCNECGNHFNREIMAVPEWYKNKNNGIYYCPTCLDGKRERKYK